MCKIQIYRKREWLWPAYKKRSTAYIPSSWLNLLKYLNSSTVVHYLLSPCYLHRHGCLKPNIFLKQYKRNDIRHTLHTFQAIYVLLMDKTELFCSDECQPQLPNYRCLLLALAAKQRSPGNIPRSLQFTKTDTIEIQLGVAILQCIFKTE